MVEGRVDVGRQAMAGSIVGSAEKSGTAVPCPSQAGPKLSHVRQAQVGKSHG
jgi:hypothetical protein